MFAKTLQLDRANELRRFKRGSNVVRRLFAEISNQKRTTSHKRVLSFLLGERFIPQLARLCPRFDKLVVARPERKLVDQILRFNQVDRRMPWTFDALIA